MRIPVLEVKQPIGSFYLAVFPAEFIVSRVTVSRRSYPAHEDGPATGIQRQLSEKRVQEIAHYTSDPDATFPTSIILNINTKENRIRLTESALVVDDKEFKAEVIDGQHRIEGLRASSFLPQFDLPVALMFDLTEEEKAYVFSTINSNQQRVDASLIYDLFALSKHRSPFRTAHEIARALNSDRDSPYYAKLKMLGRKTRPQQSLSQGAFVNSLVPLISSHPKKDLVDEKKDVGLKMNEDNPFRQYYIQEQDAMIYRILLNYFKAFQTVFTREWDNSDEFILTRSTGFGGMMLALREIGKEGLFRKDLSHDFFHSVALNLKKRLKADKLELTAKEFPSNIQQQRRLQRLIEESV